MEPKPCYMSLLPEILDRILGALPLPDALSLSHAIPHPVHSAHIRARVSRLRHLRDAWVRAKQPSLRAYANPWHLRTRRARESCSVRDFCNLTTLPLSASRLSDLTGVAELKNLRLLDVSRNDIEGLPDELGRCTELRVLHLGWNKLVSFPGVVFRLSKLTTLLLHHNRLTTLPDDWTTLPNLYRLGLYACDINTLPEQLCQVLGTQTAHRRSRSANLSGNRIEQRTLQDLFHRYPEMINAVMI